MQKCMPRMLAATLDLHPSGEHVPAMPSRRQFLSLVSRVAAASVPATARANPASSHAKPAKIRAICFDLFTLFDPRSVARAAEALFPGRGTELWNAWKTRQFEYAWLRAVGRRYVDFEAVTEAALVYAAQDQQLSLPTQARRQLVDAYCDLEPWPDARPALLAWRQAGLKLAPLANYSPRMLRRLVSRNGLEPMFDALISSDAARTYKPDPRAYALGPSRLGLPAEQIAFSAFGGWDAAGAEWFGFPTFWVNRLGVTAEQLVPPRASGPDLASLASWIAAR